MFKFISKKVTIAAVVAGLAISGCAEQGGSLSKQEAGTALGAIGGAVLGSQVGKGSGRAVGAIGGAVLGGMIGNSIGASLDRVDQQYYMRSQQNALESSRTGQTTRWSNPDSGNSGTFTPKRTYEREGRYCREYQQTIKVGGKVQSGYGTACRQPDGSWEVVN